MRSDRWLRSATVSGLLHRASLRAAGIAGLDGEGPVIGIANSWSELVHCNSHLRELAERVRQGVLMAGGIPVEFPTISLSENLMKPTTMLYRNLMAMDVEESIRAHPFDAVVLLASCDKTTPAQLMGAISADVPAIMLTGGPSEPGFCFGRELGVGTDLWKYTDDHRAGLIDADEYAQLESALIPTHGHCNEMGTASTMAALVEAMGVSLPGSAMVPATHQRRGELATETGQQAVRLARAGVALRDILDERSLRNAITVLMALGGSTNAVVHLCAFAGRLGIDLPLSVFRDISERVPVIADVRPVGRLLANDFHRAGGVPSLLRELEPFLDLEARTVGLCRLGEVPRPPTTDPACIRTVSDPVYPRGAITVVTGNLAPDGAVIKQSAATEELLVHRGPAVVFDGVDDLMRRFDDPATGVTADSVMVLRGVGPVGGPGMPEWGMVPIPDSLLRAGVRDMVRISDARMSGTAYGTMVLHVAPEAAVDGVLGVVRNGDFIELDVPAGRLHLDVDDAELDRRRRDRGSATPVTVRGYTALYRRHVLQAPQGADFDFLQHDPTEPRDNIPAGLFGGWLSGW